jgi:hypothetical protein
MLIDQHQDLVGLAQIPMIDGVRHELRDHHVCLCQADGIEPHNRVEGTASGWDGVDAGAERERGRCRGI